MLHFQSSPSSPDPASLPAEDISVKSNGPKSEVLVDDDHEDLFAGKTAAFFFVPYFWHV